MARWIVLAIFVVPGLLLALAYGWGALVVYAFFAFVAFAIAWGAGAMGEVSEAVGRLAGQGRFVRERRKDRR